MKEDHQPCVTQTCRFDLISHPSSSFKKELNFSWYFLKFWTEQSFLRTYRSSVWTAPKYVQVKKLLYRKVLIFSQMTKFLLLSTNFICRFFPFKIPLVWKVELLSPVFCFLWKLFLTDLICWEKQLYELWSPEIFHFASTVVPSAKKLMQNFRWILFEGTRGKQRVRVFWNDPRKLSFSG